MGKRESIKPKDDQGIMLYYYKYIHYAALSSSRRELIKPKDDQGGNT